MPERNWKAVSDAWLKEYGLERAEQTVLRAERVIRLYTRWRRDRDLDTSDLEKAGNRQELMDWRDHRLAHEAGKKTVANDLGIFSSFFKWCVREHYLPDNPLDRVARPRFVSKQVGQPLTRTEAGRWIRSMRPQTRRGQHGCYDAADATRKRHMAVFLLNTGLRNGELCRADVEDLKIDEHARQLCVVGKGGKVAWVPLNKAAVAAARPHLRGRGGPTHGPLFVDRTNHRYNERQLAHEIVKAGRALGIEDRVHSHNLRHSLATWMAQAGHPLHIVQGVLRHASPETTAKYYIHTAQHELASVTARLKPTSPKPTPPAPVGGQRKVDRASSRRDGSWIIPFPKHLVG